MSGSSYPTALRRLVNELTKLPSIGEKSAIRLAYHLVTRDRNEALALADAIRTARETVRLCQSCFALTDREICSICTDPNRTRSMLCVVEKPADVIALERSGGYHGLYHVLHGLWSPLRGIGPEGLRIGELITRIEASHGENLTPIEELVVATSTTVEGDATALYLAENIKHLRVGITRIAQGLPKGGELEYADEMTIQHALEGRRRL